MKKRIYLIFVSFLLVVIATAQTTSFNYKAKLPEGNLTINDVQNDVAKILSKNQTVHAYVIDSTFKKIKMLSKRTYIDTAFIVDDGIVFKTKLNTFNLEIAKSLYDIFWVDESVIQKESGKYVHIYITYPIYFDREVNVKFYSLNKELMCRLVDDFLFIKTHFINESNTKELARFTSIIAKNKNIITTPELIEEQRKYIVQANSFAKDKLYAQAIEAYKKAIAIDQVAYPAAYYNLALLLAEKKDFKEAIKNMKKYLLLVPDAPDARAAQDKIYEWER